MATRTLGWAVPSNCKVLTLLRKSVLLMPVSGVMASMTGKAGGTLSTVTV